MIELFVNRTFWLRKEILFLSNKFSSHFISFMFLFAQKHELWQIFIEAAFQCDIERERFHFSNSVVIISLQRNNPIYLRFFIGTQRTVLFLMCDFFLQIIQWH